MKLLREPLLHFFVLAAVILLVDTLRPTEAVSAGDEAADETRVIRVTPALHTHLEEGLRETLGRSPTANEREEAVRRWVDTEILVREARALGLDRDDPVIRSRLAQKLAFVHQRAALPDRPEEAVLRSVYEAHLNRFALAESITLRHLFANGPEAKGLMELLVARWIAGEDPRELAKEAEEPPGGPVLRGRSVERLGELYGPGFADAVAALEPDRPSVVRSELGWHAVSVLERKEARTLSFEAAKQRVMALWRREQEQQAAMATLDSLRSQYRVEGAP